MINTRKEASEVLWDIFSSLDDAEEGMKKLFWALDLIEGMDDSLHGRLVSKIQEVKEDVDEIRITTEQALEDNE